MADWLSSKATGRVAGLLFLTSAPLIMASLLVSGPRGHGRPVIYVLALVGAAVGVFAWAAPWDRWPPRTSLVLPVAALALISTGNSVWPVNYTFALFFVLVFAWTGLAQPRWTSVQLSPFAAAAYVIPFLLRHTDQALGLASTIVSIPVSVALGESLAWMTERLREADRVLLEAYERERALNEMKNLFLQAVSHELRTPLAVVLGLAYTLEREDALLAHEMRRGLIKSLSANARKLETLLGDLLDLDRLTRGVIEPHRRPTDVSALVGRVADTFRGPDSRLSVEAQPLVAEVDAAQVERIVENLLANASRHTPPGTPVWVRVVGKDEGVLLMVEDAGPGVPDDLKDAIFEPFRQGATPSHSPGTGIGLSLVARFAALHGGRAWVEDRPGGGASFRVLLPGAHPRRREEEPLASAG